MLYLMDVSTLLTCVSLLHGAHSAAWTYTGLTGTENWPTNFPVCGKSSQSPINIDEHAVTFNPAIGPIKYTNFDTPTDMIFTNNGHTVSLVLDVTPDVTIEGGGLPATSYKAFQLHFHWGKEDQSGSEHLVNGKAYPLELHIVHYNTKYSNPGAAVNKADGLAVLGFMYEVSETDNINYSGIVQALASIPNRGDQIGIQSVSLNSLLPEKFSQFYRYSGSLTTPPCYESVTWTVFKQPIAISELQLNGFRRLLDLVNNYRPVQPLNGRKVTANFNLENDSAKDIEAEKDGTRRAALLEPNNSHRDTRREKSPSTDRQSLAERVAKKLDSRETELNEEEDEEEDDEDEKE